MRYLLAVLLVAASGSAQDHSWTEAASVPLAPSSRTLKRGAWLAAGEPGGPVFAGKGYLTGDCYRYDGDADTWFVLSDIPPGPSLTMPDDGADGVVIDRDVYLVKGNSTFEFWRLDDGRGVWAQLPDVPGTEPVLGGRGLVAARYRGWDCVYLLKNDRGEFWRYEPGPRTWQSLPAPPGAVGAEWGEAAFLVWDGERLVYAYNRLTGELWQFDVPADTWLRQPLPGVPGGAAGGPGAWYAGAVYALPVRGREFWRYDVARDTWELADTLPLFTSTGKKASVNANADLVSLGDGRFCATRGAKSVVFWRYWPVTDIEEWRGGTQPVAGAATVVRGSLVLPSAFSVLTSGFILLDASGRRVLDLVPGPNDVSHLSPGVYFIRAEGSRGRGFEGSGRKVVIQ